MTLVPNTKPQETPVHKTLSFGFHLETNKKPVSPLCLFMFERDYCSIISDTGTVRHTVSQPTEAPNFPSGLLFYEIFQHFETVGVPSFVRDLSYSETQLQNTKDLR